VSKQAISISNFFKNANGKTVIAQRPNAPLYIWFAGMIIAKITSDSNLQQIAGGISFVALMIWALLEIFLGVNYFRRILGLIILILSIYSRVVT